MPKELKKPEPISLYFKLHLRANGETAQLEINQNTNTITLSKEQAISLAKELQRRYGNG